MSEPTSPAPTFGPVQEHLYAQDGPRKDRTAKGRLEDLAKSLGPRRPVLHHYARGSWGFTIFRTVYGPESDAQFLAAIEKLKRWVWYDCHYTRFPLFGPVGEERAITYGEPNEELARRVYFDVIEDKNLARFSSSRPQDFKGLNDYFKIWVESKGEDPAEFDNARFCYCLVIDAASLSSFEKIPLEVPPLRVAVDYEEKRSFIQLGRPAWVWILDAHTIGRVPDEEYECPGWMKILVNSIGAAWFWRLGRWDLPAEADLRYEKDDEGIFWCLASYGIRCIHHHLDRSSRARDKVSCESPGAAASIAFTRDGRLAIVTHSVMQPSFTPEIEIMDSTAF
ncbi:hypothetical protein GQ53DRAFT_761253 [Thozetella sp. PMI_491]|nr:hypothetical protein GQ53DRAFT_761253 [Thozetella sp. PMI_491]